MNNIQAWISTQFSTSPTTALCFQCKKVNRDTREETVTKNKTYGKRVNIKFHSSVYQMESKRKVTRLSLEVSVSGKAFYGIMLWRSKLNTSEASIRYLGKFQYTNEFNKSSNSYYIPECCLLLYTHCYHKTNFSLETTNISTHIQRYALDRRKFGRQIQHPNVDTPQHPYVKTTYIPTFINIYQLASCLWRTATAHGVGIAREVTVLMVQQDSFSFYFPTLLVVSLLLNKSTGNHNFHFVIVF